MTVTIPTLAYLIYHGPKRPSYEEKHLAAAKAYVMQSGKVNEDLANIGDTPEPTSKGETGDNETKGHVVGYKAEGVSGGHEDSEENAEPEDNKSKESNGSDKPDDEKTDDDSSSDKPDDKKSDGDSSSDKPDEKKSDDDSSKDRPDDKKPDDDSSSDKPDDKKSDDDSSSDDEGKATPDSSDDEGKATTDGSDDEGEKPSKEMDDSTESVRPSLPLRHIPTANTLLQQAKKLTEKPPAKKVDPTKK